MVIIIVGYVYILCFYLWLLLSYLKDSYIDYLIEISLIREGIRVEIITHIFYVGKVKQRESFSHVLEANWSIKSQARTGRLAVFQVQDQSPTTKTATPSQKKAEMGGG